MRAFTVFGFSHVFYKEGMHSGCEEKSSFLKKGVLPSRQSHLRSRSHGHTATPWTHTLRSPGTSPPLTGTAVARPQNSRPRRSGPGSLGSHRNAESLRCTGRSRTEIQGHCILHELENKALGKNSARCGSHLKAHEAV